MPTPVPLKILSRRRQRVRLIVVLILSLGVGLAARTIRPMIVGGIHYEALAALTVLSIACLVLLLGLRRIAYRRAATVFLIEGTALWLCFAAGWVIIGRRLWMDLLGVTAMFWASTVLPGLVLLWIVQRLWPPRRSMTCPGCAYDLRASTGDVCPECGASFEATCAACGCRWPRLTEGTCGDCGAPLAPDAVIVRPVRGG